MSDTISPRIHASLSLMAHELEAEIQRLAFHLGLQHKDMNVYNQEHSFYNPLNDAPAHLSGDSIPTFEHAPLPKLAAPVAEVILSAAGTGKVLVQWPEASGARRYRLQTQIEGVDEGFVTEAMTISREWPLQTLPTGAILRVRVSSVNEAGEAAPSPTASVVVS